MILEAMSDLDRLVVMPSFDANRGPGEIISALKSDHLALVNNVTSELADTVIASVADGLEILDRLELQAGFATLGGFRTNVGKYFMTVNERNDFDIIPPHSEGNRTIGIQLGATYAYENTTDGGFTIMQHTKSDADSWNVLREVTRKIDLCGRKLSAHEIASAKALHKINLPDGILGPEDEILEEIEPPTAGVRCFEVLAKPIRAKSAILGTSIYAYWDSIAVPDRDSLNEYISLLRSLDLLREPADTPGLTELSDSSRIVWSSGVRFDDLFDSMLIVKLEAGDLLIFNNLTWAHAVSNWTPGSGQRSVVVAFA